MLTNKTPWVILLLLWITGSTWWQVCRIKQLCGNVAEVANTPSDSVQFVPVVEDTGFTIADGDLFQLDLPGNFSFAKSGANANLNTLGGSLDSLVNYLKNNPGRKLAITGSYSATETNTTTFPNLGLARAEAIKQYLIQQGVSAESLTTRSAEQSLSFNAARGDSLYGGLEFTFIDPEPAPAADTATTPVAPKLTESVTEKELADAEKFTSVFKPIDLYFQLGETNYIQTKETKKFFDEARVYLSAHKDKKLVLTGHTDNSGPDDVNLRLSKGRANDVMRKLQKAGIDGGQIDVRAKGETDPKADNSTLSGRKANRRVTVVVE